MDGSTPKPNTEVSPAGNANESSTAVSVDTRGSEVVDLTTDDQGVRSAARTPNNIAEDGPVNGNRYIEVGTLHLAMDNGAVQTHTVIMRLLRGSNGGPPVLKYALSRGVPPRCGDIPNPILADDTATDHPCHSFQWLPQFSRTVNGRGFSGARNRRAQLIASWRARFGWVLDSR
ncbi:hypothetical protein MBLNU230_g4874t1 [Neophaeotheca triangularis]